MKKIVFLLLMLGCLPWTLLAQSVDDDLYFVPSKKKVEKKEPVKVKPAPRTVVVKSQSPTTVISSDEGTAIVVRNQKKGMRDVDEYNRRYESKDYSFSRDGKTLYIDEREDDGLDGEWVNGFEGSQDDYEYATRIIRFRNPRFAVSISSPFYWDIVYGLNSWEWNVYTDGFYAYAFPTFSNRLWWDWRYSSYGWGYPYYSFGWNSWYGPSWSFSWGGWHGGWCGPHYHHHHYYHPHYHHSWYPGGHWAGRPRVYNTYTRRGVPGLRSDYRGSAGIRRPATSHTRSEAGQVRSGNRSSYNRSNVRVVGTRNQADRSSSVRTTASETRRSTYTRPSSTRSGSTYRPGSTDRSSGSRPAYSGERRSSNRGNATYNRGSSRTSTRSHATEGSNRRSSYSNSRSSSNSFGSPSRGSSSRGSYSSGGGSSRSHSSGGGSRSRR